MDNAYKNVDENRRRLVGEGVELENEDEYELAIARYRELLKLSENDHARGMAHARIAECLRRLDRIDEALESAREAVRLAPRLYWAWHSLGEALYEDEKFDEALRSAEKGLECARENRDMGQALGLVGRCRIELGTPQLAEEPLREAAVLDPERELAYVTWLAFAMREAGDLDAAVKAYSRSAEIYPRPDVLCILGGILIHADRRTEAREALTRAVKAGRSHWPIHDSTPMERQSRSEALHALSTCVDWETESEAYLREGLELWAENPLIHKDLGWVELERGTAEQARDHFERAVELRPDLCWAWIGLGELHDDEGDTSAALDCYERAANVDPSDAEPWFRRGEIHARLGDREKALEALQVSLSLDPEDQEIIDAIESLGGFGREESDR